MSSPKTKVLFIASAQDWYVRNTQIINILKEEYSLDIIISSKNNYFFRIVEVLGKYFFQPNKKQYAFIFVGFLAQPLLPFVRLFYRGPIFSDFFISLYDTICDDRQIVNKKSILAKIIFSYEKWTAKLANKMFCDTTAGREYLSSTFGIVAENIHVLYVLPEKSMFSAAETNVKNANDDFQIFFYGSGRSLHGLDVILGAAQILKDGPIRFTLVGPWQKKYPELVKKNNFNKVTVIDWLPYKELPRYIQSTDICLGGHFGNSDKARRTIAGKTFQFMLMQKPVILSNTVANRELFEHKVDCFMIENNNAEELARAIETLMNNKDLSRKIALGGFAKINSLYTNNKV